MHICVFEKSESSKELLRYAPRELIVVRSWIKCSLLPYMFKLEANQTTRSCPLKNKALDLSPRSSINI